MSGVEYVKWQPDMERVYVVARGGKLLVVASLRGTSW